MYQKLLRYWDISSIVGSFVSELVSEVHNPVVKLDRLRSWRRETGKFWSGFLGVVFCWSLRVVFRSTSDGLPSLPDSLLSTVTLLSLPSWTVVLPLFFLPSLHSGTWKLYLSYRRDGGSLSWRPFSSVKRYTLDLILYQPNSVFPEWCSPLPIRELSSVDLYNLKFSTSIFYTNVTYF